MQNTPVTPTNVEISEKASMEEILYNLPEELLGVMPEAVWQGLSVDQKKELLRQNNIYEKYVPSQESSNAEQSQASEQISTPEVMVEQVQNAASVERNPEFADAVREVEELEEETPKNDVDAQDQKRMEEETLASQNAGKGSWGAKVFGYTVSDSTVNQVEDLSSNGNLEDGRTWAATLIKKILAVFGQ